MQKFRTIVFAFAALIFVSTGWCDESKLVRITGRVLDSETMEPISGLNVRVERPNHHANPDLEIWKAVTDKDGNYEFLSEREHVHSLFLSIEMTEEHVLLKDVPLTRRIESKERSAADARSRQVFEVEAIAIEPRRVFQVQVVDADGSPVPEAVVEFPARVKIHTEDGGYLRDRIKTDENGLVTFPYVSTQWCPRPLVANQITRGVRRTGSLEVTEPLLRSNSKLPLGKTLAVIVLRKPIVIRGRVDYSETQLDKRSSATLLCRGAGRHKNILTPLTGFDVGEDGAFSFESTPGLELAVWIVSRDKRHKVVPVPPDGKVRDLGTIVLGEPDADD